MAGVDADTAGTDDTAGTGDTAVADAIAAAAVIQGQLTDAIKEQNANQTRIIALIENQKTSLVGALAAVVSGNIGERAGLGFQTPGYAGQMSRL
jgi:predicted lipoprotein